MTMYIRVDSDPDTVTVHVIDGTGRDDEIILPRYPHPDSALYVQWVDILDMMMSGSGR